MTTLRSLQVRRSFGFTLLELIVAVIILALLAAVALPASRALINRTYDKTAQVELAAAFRYSATLAGLGQTGSQTGFSLDDFAGYPVYGAADGDSGDPAVQLTPPGTREHPGGTPSPQHGVVALSIVDDNQRLLMAMMSRSGRCALLDTLPNGPPSTWVTPLDEMPNGACDVRRAAESEEEVPPPVEPGPAPDVTILSPEVDDVAAHDTLVVGVVDASEPVAEVAFFLADSEPAGAFHTTTVEGVPDHDPGGHDSEVSVSSPSYPDDAYGAVWSPAQAEPGVYTIEVTATDIYDQTGTATVTVLIPEPDVEVAPDPVPVDPLTLTAAGGVASASLEWTAANADNVASYLVSYERTSGGGAGSESTGLASCTDNECATTVTGLDAAQNYTFNVVARDAGESVVTSSNTAETGTAPRAADSFNVFEAPAFLFPQGVIGWQAAHEDYGQTGYAPLSTDGYRLWRSESTSRDDAYPLTAPIDLQGEEDNLQVGSYPGDETALIGVTYHYWLETFNEYGSVFTSRQTATVSSSTATATGYRQRVDVSWDALPSGSGATGYSLTRYRDGLGESPSTFTVSGRTTTSLSQTALGTGRRYSYTIHQVGGASDGQAIAQTSALTAPPATTPSASPGPGQVTVSWSAARSATSYQLHRCVTGACSAAQRTLVADTSKLTYTDTSVAPTTDYTYYLTPWNSAVQGGPERSVATGTPPARPSSVTASQVSNDGSGYTNPVTTNASLSATWPASTGAGHYRVQLFRDGKAHLTIPSTTNRSAAWSNRAFFYDYQVRVQACNGWGCSDARRSQVRAAYTDKWPVVWNGSVLYDTYVGAPMWFGPSSQPAHTVSASGCPSSRKLWRMPDGRYTCYETNNWFFWDSSRLPVHPNRAGSVPSS